MRIPIDFGRPAFWRRAYFAAVLLASGNLQPAHADVSVTGSADDLEITADNSNVGEVLDALSKTFNLSYRGLDDLARPVSGRFEGSLLQFLARLLRGHDYVLRRNAGNELEVVWIKTSAQRAGSALTATEQPDAPSPNPQGSVYRPNASSRPPVVIQAPPAWRSFVAKAAAKHMPDRSAKAYGVGKYRRR